MDLDQALVEEFRRVHGVHTLVLYGSLARGDATAESDIDLAGFADTVRETTRDARRWEGRFLDGFVYPTAQLAVTTPEMTKLVGGRVLLDERGLAGPMLAALAALDREPPPPLPETEQRMLRVWAQKMLARIARDDIEARYRRHWLLFQLLEDYHALRGLRYRGPKLALAHLAVEAPEVHAAFERALAPAASFELLAALVELVGGRAP